MKNLRESKGFTQKQISEKLGVTVGYISEIENGRKKIGIGKIIKLAEIYNVSVEAILRKIGYEVKMRHIVISDKEDKHLVASITDEEIILHNDYTADIEFLT